MATTNEVRRSTRERKQTQEYAGASQPKKDRGETSHLERADESGDDEFEHELDMDEKEKEDDDGPEYIDPRPVKLRRSAMKSKHATRPIAKKARAITRTPKVGGTRIMATSHDAKDASINDDNSLFNSLLNPATALQSTVHDFLDSLEAKSDAALAELITCILRLCGCNSTVDSHVVVDSDGVVDFLADLVEEVKESESQQYPLASRAPAFRKLRKSISEFFDRLVASSSENETLFSTELIPTLQTWVVAMSSALLRSFRHTATAVALELESALSSVAAVIEKEAEMINRQREGERKRRKGTHKPSERDKSLQKKASEIKDKRTKMNEYLKEFFDGVFVHRYRDSDAGIRADCVREMGIWLKRHPAYFLEGNYLRYVGWVLSDTNTGVRLEAVKSLLALYQKEDYLITLQHFTERFKPRLVVMAKHDTELSVRVAMIQVLEAIDKNSLLDDDQRESLCLLIFDQEPRVRKAISAFVQRIWDETVAQRLVRRSGGDERERGFANAKALAMLLVSWEKALAKTGEPLQSDEVSGTETTSKRVASVDVDVTILAAEQRSRISLAIDALWDHVNIVQNWEAILQLLLLDHSNNIGAESAPASASKLRKKSKASPRQKRKGEDDEDVANEAWRLEETEETVLLNVLLASLQKTYALSMNKKASDADVVRNDLTRVLMKALPQLFSRHQTDDVRMIDILAIPRLLNLNLYLEMRMLTTYEGLWDDVSKQILTQSSPSVISSALSTMMYLLQATALSSTNSTKISELEDELTSSLRDIVSNREEIETSSFHEDEVALLAATTMRLQLLSARRNMASWIEDDDNGKQSSSWDIILAFAERGRLGHKEEDLLVQNCLNILTQYMTWKVSDHRSEQPQGENLFVGTAVEKRDALLRLLKDYVGGSNSNASEGVKRTAFQNFIVLHILFPRDGTNASLGIKMDDRLQYQCAGFVQAEAERFHEEVVESREPTSRNGAESGSGPDSGSDGEPPISDAKKRDATHKGNDQDKQPLSHSVLENEHAFISVINYFLRAIAAGAISPHHSATLLAYHSLLGNQFDHCLSSLISVLREEGMFKNNGELVAIVVNEALRQSFTMFMDGQTDSPQPCVNLAKAFSPAFVVRGAHLSISRRLGASHVVEIHSTSLTWITKRIAAYEASGNRSKKMQCLEFFRVVHALLASIESRDASKIKSHLDKTLEASGLEIPPTARGWDAARLYEKRLITAMSKDKGIVAKGRAAASKKSEKPGEGITDDEYWSENQDVMLNAGVSRDQTDALQTGDVFDGREIESESPSKRNTDQLRPRPRPRMRTSPRSSAPSSPEGSPVRNVAPETPASTRKRRRTPMDERDDVSDSGDAAAISALIERQENSLQKPVSSRSQVSTPEFEPRKRVRR